MTTVALSEAIVLFCSLSASYEVSEAILLREIIFVFQGIEGKLIRLDSASDAYRIDPKVGVPKAVRDLINKLAELGWLYRKVRKYLDARAGDKAMGLVGQSFCSALQQELAEYYRLLAVLEGQQQAGDQGIGEGASGSLTLRRLVIWTFDPLTRLRTVAALVDTCKGMVHVCYMNVATSLTQVARFNLGFLFCWLGLLVWIHLIVPDPVLGLR